MVPATESGQRRDAGAKGRRSPGRSVRSAAGTSTRPADTAARPDRPASGGRRRSKSPKPRQRKASKSPKASRKTPELQKTGSARTGTLAKKILGPSEKRLWGSAEASASQQLEMEYLRKLAYEPIGVATESSSGSHAASEIFGQESMDSQLEGAAAAAAEAHTDSGQPGLPGEDSWEQAPNVTNLMLAMALGVNTSGKQKLEDVAPVPEESGSTAADTELDSRRLDPPFPEALGGAGSQPDAHVETRVCNVGREPSIAATEASWAGFVVSGQAIEGSDAAAASCPQQAEARVPAQSSSQRSRAEEPVFALSIDRGEMSYTEASRSRQGSTGSSVSATSWASRAASRPSTASSRESTMPSPAAAGPTWPEGSRGHAAGPPGPTNRRPVHTRPCSAPVLGPQRKLLGTPTKHNPRSRLLALAQRIENQKAELQMILQDKGYGVSRKLSRLPDLSPELQAIKSDLARLQKEVLCAPVPDKLCDSLGGALIRMEPARRTALYNGVAALGFYSLQDFLYQAATAAECSSRHKSWQKKGLQLSREVSARKKPPPSTRTPGYPTPDLAAAGLT